MLKENAINNLKVYNAGMKKSCLDKIFFIDKVDSTVFVDFGYADGTMIKFLNSLFPEYSYIEYDISSEMIETASNNCEVEINKNIKLFSNWGDVVDEISTHNKEKITLVMNSIIHEVYSYGTKSDVEETWKRVFYDDIFDYIIIRDMISSSSIDRTSDINDVAKVLREGNSKYIRDFEMNWGSIEQNKNLVHFLLKYRYTDNWEREVKENYFPIAKEELLATIPRNYNIEFYEYFTLPYLKLLVKRDFGIDLKDKTHIKLILRKN